MSLDKIVTNKGKIKQFNSKGIENIEDLVSFLPRAYIDYTNPKKIKDVKDNEDVAIVVTIKKVQSFAKVDKVITEDSNGDILELIYFNMNYVVRKMFPNNTILVCGKIKINKDYGGVIQMVNPDHYDDIDEGLTITPIYSKITGMSDNYLKNSIDKALSIQTDFYHEYLEDSIIKKYDLVSRYDAYKNLHQPTNNDSIKEAQRRLDFDELFRFSLIRNYLTYYNNTHSSLSITKADSISPFLDKLPFTLTDDQLNTVRHIFVKMRKGKATTSLIQGDVGSGKTIVAILTMIIVAENGYQAALMAPTQVLAEQHYNEVLELTNDIGFIKPVFLLGNMKTKEKEDALNGIESGKYNFIIGTHALTTDNVKYNNLGLAIIDEEHRFGVLQRESFKEKSSNNIHMISMSATPIPRTLAITMYGDNTDVYNIKTMPSGRKPVKTQIEVDKSKAYDFLLQEINKGRQGYIVCPLIEESNAEVLEGVRSVEEVYQDIKEYFKNNPEVKIGVITGDMKKEDVQEEITKFKNLDYNVIISTTIIEVGVNVPNSTIMIIENSERFGLAQLHQLRGRVGRGSHQSYCLLLTEKKNVKRLNLMEQTNDGFKIALEDLNYRGLGDFLGTQQSGDNKAVNLMINKPDLYNEISNITLGIINDENKLNFYKNIIDDYDIETESDKSMPKEENIYAKPNYLK